MENLYSVIYTLDAKEDLYNITEYISNNLCNQQAAYNFLVQLERTIEYLQASPLSAALSKSPKLASKNVRFTMVKNYKLFYAADENKQLITILYIKHSLQNIDNVL